MEFTAKQIAEFIQGRVEGNEQATVSTFAKIEEGVPGAISFLSNPKYTHYLYDTKSSIVLVNEDVELEKPVSATIIRVKNAYECIAKLLLTMPLDELKQHTTFSGLNDFARKNIALALKRRMSTLASA